MNIDYYIRKMRIEYFEKNNVRSKSLKMSKIQWVQYAVFIEEKLTEIKLKQ